MRLFHQLKTDVAVFAFAAAILGCVMSAGCGAREAQPVMGEYIVLQAQQPAKPVVTPIVAVAVAAPAPKLFADGIRSVKFLRATTLRKSPTDDTKIGVINGGARAAVTDAVVADGCKTR